MRRACIIYKNLPTRCTGYDRFDIRVAGCVGGAPVSVREDASTTGGATGEPVRSPPPEEFPPPPKVYGFKYYNRPQFRRVDAHNSKPPTRCKPFDVANGNGRTENTIKNKLFVKDRQTEPERFNARSYDFITERYRLRSRILFESDPMSFDLWQLFYNWGQDALYPFKTYILSDDISNGKLPT